MLASRSHEMETHLFEIPHVLHNLAHVLGDLKSGHSASSSQVETTDIPQTHQY
jgi:hypothetical protein